MLSRLKPTIEDSSRPLLGDDEVLFTVDDGEDDIEVTNEPNEPTSIDDRSIPPPLRSMVQSREIGEQYPLDNVQGDRLTSTVEYELDTDELEDNPTTHLPSRRDPQTMPLLVGLIDSAQARTANLDGPGIPMSGMEDSEGVDLEELAEKRIAGGGLLDSIANMSNSILGAGKGNPGFEHMTWLTEHGKA